MEAKKMNNIIIIGGTITGVIGFTLLLYYLAYKKVNVSSILSSIEKLLKGTETITEVIGEYSTGKVKKADEFAKFLLEQAINFVQGTEQMYVSSQISADERKNTAINAITDLLEVQGVEITDKLKNVIGMYVEKACSDDTIKNINEKIDKLIQEKVTPFQKEKESIQTQTQQLQSQVSQLTTENTNLKNTITTVASTVQTTTQTPQ
jgi:hypothetical protein